MPDCGNNASRPPWARYLLRTHSAYLPINNIALGSAFATLRIKELNWCNTQETCTDSMRCLQKQSRIAAPNKTNNILYLLAKDPLNFFGTTIALNNTEAPTTER